MSVKTKCEVKFDVVCRGNGVIYLTGVKKEDPKFRCCLACQAYLRRMGVRTKEAK